ncbi:hypothetical protein PR048_020236 [Dryococelus australis]|uniref:Uncharacterized protein n=1 Tax=Dryococelus australis TaxID=614101 RepID=A0ABQ9H5T4_9NEOP|nr:hypothetical protein PR048_020236 [Dryococelus australis]
MVSFKAKNYLALNSTNLSVRYLLSLHRKLLEKMPYGPNLMVEKVECKNHIPNCCRKGTKFRTVGNEPLNTRICMLKANVENSPLHIFGDQEHCDVYFCNGNNEGEINHFPELKSRGLLQEIMKIICGSVSRHVSSLRADQKNMSELFNSIVNKHVEGKRIVMLS